MANCPNDSATTGLLLTSSRYCASATAFAPQITAVPSLIATGLTKAPLASATPFSDDDDDDETDSDSSYVMPSALPSPQDQNASGGLSMKWIGIGAFACLVGIFNL